LGEPSAQAKDKGVIGLGVVITLVSLIGAFALGDYTLKVVSGDQGEGKWTTATDVITLDGTVAPDSSKDKEVIIDQPRVLSVTFTLTFKDEPNADSRHTNEPDSLSLEVSSEFGSDQDEAVGDSGSGGEMSLVFTAPDKKPWDTREKVWNATVTAVSIGNQEPLVPDPMGFRTIIDPGNDYSLSVEIVYQVKA